MFITRYQVPWYYVPGTTGMSNKPEAMILLLSFQEALTKYGTLVLPGDKSTLNKKGTTPGYLAPWVPRGSTTSTIFSFHHFIFYVSFSLKRRQTNNRSTVPGTVYEYVAEQ